MQRCGGGCDVIQLLCADMLLLLWLQVARRAVIAQASSCSQHALRRGAEVVTIACAGFPRESGQRPQEHAVGRCCCQGGAVIALHLRH
jgi:hypothetical protein